MLKKLKLKLKNYSTAIRTVKKELLFYSNLFILLLILSDKYARLKATSLTN